MISTSKLAPAKTTSLHHFGDPDTDPDAFSISIIESMKEEYGLFVWPCSTILAEYVWQQRLRFLRASVVEVYTSALKLVRSMLPLPYLKVGHLIAPPVGSPTAPHCDWKLTQFVLNHEGLEQLHEVEHKQSRNVYGNIVDPDNNRPAIKVDIPDIVSVSACADLTLPPGTGLCIHTIHGPVYLAIWEVGEVIQFYDFDWRFPSWGFGGKKPDGSVSHCFDLIPSCSEVEGVEGKMFVYAGALHTVALHGPTLFGPVINKAAENAGRSITSSINCKYFVLLIITDGVMTDLKETKYALMRASDLPLSVLIMGVGNADFKQMQLKPKSPMTVKQEKFNSK